MPFSEEVPKDRKCRCGCKRRNCEMQRLLKLDGGRVVFTYECMSPAIWRTCARCIDPDMPKSQTSQKSQELPATEQPPAPFSCPFEGCHFVAKNEFALNKHLDSIHHAAVATPVYEAEPVCEGIGEKP